MLDPEPYLDRLNRLIDVEHVRSAEERQLKAWTQQPLDRLPTIISVYEDRRHVRHDWPPDWPHVGYGDAFRDPPTMLIHELTRVYEGALLKDDRAYSIRANYGVPILPSVLGCTYQQLGDDMPQCHSLASMDMIDNLLHKGIPDIRAGLAAKSLETEEYFLEALYPFANLRETVRIGCPDTQGPFNLASIVAGSSIYLAIYDSPGLVSDLMALCTSLYIAFTKAHNDLVGTKPGTSYHWGMQCRGARIVDDSAVNLSEEMYRRYVVPFNRQIGQALGGFWGHYCGKGQQILYAMLDTEGITGIHFGNPEMQTLSEVAQAVARRGICVLWEGTLDPGDRIIRTGLIHKRTASTWAEAETLARGLAMETLDTT